LTRYGTDTISQVLAAIDIVDLIGQSLHLQPAGPGRLKALCPFHHEKTPSFVVNRARQTFHCFGCGEGGDALSFITKHEGLTFSEALRKLADRAGVPLPAQTQQGTQAEQLRQELLAFTTFATKHFSDNLHQPLRGAQAKQYLATRALKAETITRFGLGFAPESWDDLLAAARTQSFKQDTLNASGLFKTSEVGKTYDFFRNRLIIPIKDTSGNTVAFGGRDLSGESPAKYINSPETPIYKKSRVLYGLHDARETLRTAQYAIMVEGYFDLLRCFDNNIQNVVATCGTALTPDQATLIRRYVPEVVLVYDGDPAGIKAALKGTSVLTAAGLTVRALALPDGQDPDDYIRHHGAESFLTLVKDAPDFVTFYATMSQDRTRTIEGRTQVAHELFEILTDISDALRLDEYLKQAARALGLNPQACKSEFDKYRRAAANSTPAASSPTAPDHERFSYDDLVFVAALLENPALLEQARASLDGIQLPETRLAEVLQALFTSGPDHIARDIQTDEARRLYAAAANTEYDPSKTPEVVRKRITRLQAEAHAPTQAALLRTLTEADHKSDQGQQKNALQELIELRRRTERVGNF